MGRRLAFALLLALPGCAPPLKGRVDVEALLRAEPEAAFASGRTLGLGEPAVLNNQDFVYAVAFDEGAREVAFVHHVTTFMELTVGVAEPWQPRFRKPVNHHEFDVEDVAFLERDGGRWLVLPSRQGLARRARADDGEVDGEFAAGQPLVRVAVSPRQELIALGATDGRVVVLDARSLAFRGEARPHADEVQGLAFLDERTLLSASFDGDLVVSRLSPGAPDVVRLSAARLEGGQQAFLAHLDGARAISTVRDVRQPSHAVSRAAVERLALAPSLDGATAEVLTPLGAEARPTVELGELVVRYLSLGRARAAVCDECVPAGAELVLGTAAAPLVTFGDDFAAREVMARASGAAVVEGALLVEETRRLSLPGPATDLDVDARGRLAVVAYSHAKARRSPEIYDAEKKGIYPPPSGASGAVVVDVAAFALGRRYIGHRGFTVTAALSPDGKTVATGGWDKRLLVFDAATGALVVERELAWLLRRARFSPDGRLLAAAAWTPASPAADVESEPSLLLYPVVLDERR